MSPKPNDRERQSIKTSQAEPPDQAELPDWADDLEVDVEVFEEQGGVGVVAGRGVIDDD